MCIRDRGEVHDKARAFASKAGLVAIVGGAIYLLWFQLAYSAGLFGWVLLVLAALGLVCLLYTSRCV